MTELKRSLNLFLISFYGIGTILGAGIYVLIGKVADSAGMYAPWSFLLAAVIAGFSAVSYMELSSRYPKSAGEAVYIQIAFKQKWLSTFIGWLVVFTGIVSSATIANGFIGYLNIFIPIPETLAVIVLIITLIFIAIIGVKESVGLASFITFLEIAGLVIVILIAGENLSQLPERFDELIPDLFSQNTEGPHPAMAIAIGAILAFYAFIGFEDIVNMAEEVKNPERNLPLAIIISVILSTFLYVLIALIAIFSLPMDVLSQSTAPMADIFAAQSSLPTEIIAAISLVAVINGALIQMIMASRVLYGLAKQGMAPNIFSTVAKKQQTPWLGIILVGIVVLFFAVWLPLAQLAVITSIAVLVIFALVNAALLVVKYQKIESHSENYYKASFWFAIFGLIGCIALIYLQATNMLSVGH